MAIKFISYLSSPRKCRRAFAGAFMLLAALTVSGASNLVFPRSNTATVGIVIRDLASGKDLVTENAGKFMTPASILKCVTAASTLLDGSAGERFSTETFLQGDLDLEGVFRGNVVVRGVGDPTTESDNFPLTAGMPDSIARRLFDMGIRKIVGRVMVDTLGLQEQGPGYGWEYSDLRHSYGAGLYALNYRDNATEGARAVTDPVRRFTSEVGRAFTRNGIELTDSIMDTDGNMSLLPVYIHRSPTKEEILRVMMEQSHNLYAEAMLRALAPGSECEEALQKEVDLLSSLGLDMTCLNAFDGSGLSRQDALTPLFMADMLQRMATTPFADRYVALFPKAGLEGTVKRFLCDTPLEGRMVLKSGSMRGVQTFAGYKLDDCGKPTHVVVIMVNQFVCNRDAVRKAMTNMLLRYFPG